MTTTELAIRNASLPEKIQYAKFLAESGLLPPSYRKQPANILFAAEYGDLLGLHPMAAITGIHVIDGRPAVSAGLMSALVRRAGHRIRVQGNAEQATCEITRADDPGFTYSVTWTMERAKLAGLLGRSNWQHYPVAMLKARAVSECTRDACQELLLGMQYTPDELGGEDDGGEVIHDGFPAGRDGALRLSEMSEDAKEAAGVMTRPHRIQHAALVREVHDEPRRSERLREADPDDPWAEPAKPPAQPQPASKAALERLDKLVSQIDLGPDEDVRSAFEWLTGEPWTATRSQVDQAYKWLDDHLKAANGDVAVAADAAWKQYRAANPQAGDDAP